MAQLVLGQVGAWSLGVPASPPAPPLSSPAAPGPRTSPPAPASETSPPAPPVPGEPAPVMLEPAIASASPPAPTRLSAGSSNLSSQPKAPPNHTPRTSAIDVPRMMAPPTIDPFRAQSR